MHVPSKTQGNFISLQYKIVSDYDQEIPHSQTADKPMTPQGRATQQLRDTRKTVNVLSETDRMF